MVILRTYKVSDEVKGNYMIWIVRSQKEKTMRRLTIWIVMPTQL